MFHKAALLKESIENNIGLYSNHNIEKLVDILKLKMELCEEKDREKKASDNEDGITAKVKDIEASVLQQTDVQNYQLARDKVRRQPKAAIRYGYAILLLMHYCILMIWQLRNLEVTLKLL